MISGTKAAADPAAMPPTAGAAELTPAAESDGAASRGDVDLLSPWFGASPSPGVATSACWLCADGARGESREVHAETHKTKKTSIKKKSTFYQYITVLYLGWPNE